jgi:hypothetical protein
MTPILREGRIYRPIIPSRIETERGEILIDGLEEVLPGDPEYDRLLEWLQSENVIS